MITTTEIEVRQVSNRGDKFGITVGKAVLAKFKTIEEAKQSLNQKQSFYNYWAESASVSIQNAKWRDL